MGNLLYYTIITKITLNLLNLVRAISRVQKSLRFYFGINFGVKKLADNNGVITLFFPLYNVVKVIIVIFCYYTIIKYVLFT